METLAWLVTFHVFVEITAFETCFILGGSYNDNLTDSDGTLISSCDIFECAITCTETEACQQFSFMFHRCLCVLQGSRATGGWTTWKKHTLNQAYGEGNMRILQDEWSTERIPSLKLLQYSHNMTMYQACCVGRLDVVKHLLAKTPADINCRARNGRTPVMAAARNGKAEVFDFLVSKGCDLKLVDKHSFTVLHVACMGGNIKILRTLVNKQYDIDIQTAHGKTPVLVAAKFGHTEIIGLLAKSSSNLRAVDRNGNNILHCACFGGDVDTVEYIISRKIVSIDSRNRKMKTPVMIAAGMGHMGAVVFLAKTGCSLTAVDDSMNNILHHVCWKGLFDVAKYIIALGKVSIESRGYRGFTPVLVAAEKGHIDIVQLLVSRGCCLTSVTNSNDNVLHVASSNGQLKVAKFILSLEEVDRDSKGYTGRTAIMMAALKGHKEVFDFLKIQGCNLATSDDDGNTILHLASSHGNVDIVRDILTFRTVEANIKNKFGRTPLQVAKLKRQRKIIDLLDKIGK